MFVFVGCPNYLDLLKLDPSSFFTITRAGKQLKGGDVAEFGDMLDVRLDPTDKPSFPVVYENLFIQLHVKAQRTEGVHSRLATCFHTSVCNFTVNPLSNHLQSFGFYFQQKSTVMYIGARMIYHSVTFAANGSATVSKTVPFVIDIPLRLSSKIRYLHCL